MSFDVELIWILDVALWTGQWATEKAKSSMAETSFTDQATVRWYMNGKSLLPRKKVQFWSAHMQTWARTGQNHIFVKYQHLTNAFFDSRGLPWSGCNALIWTLCCALVMPLIKRSVLHFALFFFPLVADSGIALSLWNLKSQVYLALETDVPITGENRVQSNTKG